jgi:hypothetical protein
MIKYPGPAPSAPLLNGPLQPPELTLGKPHSNTATRRPRGKRQDCEIQPTGETAEVLLRSGGGLDGRGSPRLVLMRQPDQLGVEGAHPQLSYGMRLVELAERHRQVADDDYRARASLDDDHL